MSQKNSNEITIKIKCKLNELYKILEEKGFKITRKFTMDDTYFIPKETKLEKNNATEILSKAVFVRDIEDKTSNKRTKLITFKIKNFDESGNILSQESTNCNILEIDEAKNLLKSIGYTEIMNIKENDTVYEKDRFELAIKDIENGDNLIEIEENNELDTIEKLIQKINEIEIPIYTDDYFVKKAEIELDKILTKKANIEKFYDNTKDMEPNYTVRKFLKLNIEPGNAVELGCAAGRDTVSLIKDGWNVLAIDREEVEARITTKLSKEEQKKFKFSKQKFEDIKLDKNNLVVANSISKDTEEESVSQFFHILNSVDQQRGCCELDDGKYEITLYTSCCNANKGMYYYTTYNNHQITAVDMNKENLDSKDLIRCPLITEEQIRIQNK